MKNSIEFFLNTYLEWSLSHQDSVITKELDNHSETLITSIPVHTSTASGYPQSSLTLLPSSLVGTALTSLLDSRP